MILLCGICVSAQTGASAASSSQDVTTGIISGSVVGENGQPLAGAVVYVRNINPVTFIVRSSHTGADGSFRVKGLAPALYSISTSYPAYITQPTNATAPTYFRPGDTVRIEMTRGAVITGTVTNASGEPLIGVRVRVAMLRNGKGESPRYGIVIYQERATDDRGIYRIFGLPAGTYLVSGGGSTTTQSFVLTPYDTDIPTYSPSSTRADAAEITVRAGEEATADIHYRGEPGRSVSGNVKTTGMSSASVTLSPVGNRVVGGNTTQVRDAAGRFTFYGVADGEYDLIAQEQISSVGTQTAILISEPRRVTVKGADVSGIELVTRPLGSISGQIVLEPAKTSPCQGKRRPSFAEMVVTIQRSEINPNDTSQYLRPAMGSASPDEKGSFALRNLVPGRYVFEPHFYAKYWYLRAVNNAATPRIDSAANWTTLKSGEHLSNFTITLAEGAAAVQGRVNNEDGVRSETGVYLLPAEREKSADVLRYFVTTVAADGTFAFNSLPPGRYFSVVRTLDADANTIAKLRLPDAAAARTRLLRAAETQSSPLELKPCQNLTDFQPKQ